MLKINGQTISTTLTGKEKSYLAGDKSLYLIRSIVNLRTDELNLNALFAE